eukprot:scaffold37335_cov18-Prasinocladus_malaysianus.AAC.1
MMKNIGGNWIEPLSISRDQQGHQSLLVLLRRGGNGHHRLAGRRAACKSVRRTAQMPDRKPGDVSLSLRSLSGLYE